MNCFDFSTVPYNTLPIIKGKCLKKQQILSFDDNAAIIEAQDSIDTLYIIIKGMVKEIDASGEILALYHPSDSFDTRALFGQSYRHSFIAVEQSLLYAMPKTIIRTLIEENSEFSAYFLPILPISSKINQIIAVKMSWLDYSLPKCVMLIAHMMSCMMAQLV